MKICGIYKICSIRNPERNYIGSSISIKDRWDVHINFLRSNKHNNKKLQRHFNKYGESDLQFLILLNCKKEELILFEQQFIDFYNPYFNIRMVAENNLGIKYSKASRLKMSKAMKGIKRKPLSDEHKKKISKALKGKKISNLSFANLKIIHKGDKLSEETKRKIGIKNTGKKRTEKEKELRRLRMLNYRHSEESKMKMRKPKPEGFGQKIKDSWILRKLQINKNQCHACNDSGSKVY